MSAGRVGLLASLFAGTLLAGCDRGPLADRATRTKRAFAVALGYSVSTEVIAVWPSGHP